MKKLALILLLPVVVLIAGCSIPHNFMDIDNPNATEELKSVFGDLSGKSLDVDLDSIVPDSLSGHWENVKGYAEQYYQDTMGEYVDKAKTQISGTVQNLKNYYNEGVDNISDAIGEQVTNTISDELNKLKL